MLFFITWVGIGFFSEKLYERQKSIEMEKNGSRIEKLIVSNAEIQSVINEMDYTAYGMNGNIILFHQNGEQIYSTGIGMGMGGMGRGMMMRQVELPSWEGKSSTFYTHSTTMRGNVTWLTYGKKLDQGYILLLQTPYQSIDEAVKMIQNVFLILFIIAMGITLIIAYILSQNLTKPIHRLTEIAQEMGKLNFTLQYEEERNDEIGELGRTLNHITKKLEETIHQLTVELEKEKSLDKMRKKFVAQVSHELQTPLTIIHGYVEALQDHMVESKEEESEYYGVIEDEVNKMSKIVRDLLDLSQLETGSFQLIKKELDYGDVVERVYRKFIPIAEKMGVNLYLDKGKKNLSIMGDATRMEQVIFNMLQNALKHTPKEGKITIQVTKDDEEIITRIINEGDPIPEEDLPNVWEAFYKSSKKGTKKGTGLGLAISRQIILKHRGKYEVNNLQNGVCFGFSLPVI